MKMQKKTLKLSLFLTILTLSILIPIITVSACKQKQHWMSAPIYINNNVEGFTWEDWSAQPWLKGSGTEEDPYIIKNLSIDVTDSVYAMMIQDSSVYFKIMKCTFRNLGIEGERTAGLILVGTQNGVIFKNQFIGNTGAGIALIASEHNMIQKNLCCENGIGIYNEWGMFNTIKQNDCMNNLGSGIVIASAHKTIIEKNICTKNAESGITLINIGTTEHSPKDNIIYANKIKENAYGIYLEDADLNDFFRNTVKQNMYGILINTGSEENTIYHNNIIKNAVQSVDFGTPLNNWYHPYMEEGNYWSDYSGVDDNEDGIGDTTFGYDAYPLMEKGGWDLYTPTEEEVLNAFFNNVNRLGADRTVNGSKTSYIIYGVAQLFSERINGEASPPYEMKINEMVVVDSVWYFDEEVENYGEPGLVQLYYLKLPPNFLFDEMGLIPGYWEYLVELSWYNSGELQVMSFTTGFFLI